ncbi:MAG: HAD-IC family P-type ATPase, partial [archaeon]|nr:HAD-IC family P-type ATPase [archaeon]
RHGILLRDGGAVERLARVDTVLLDKTGTLTTGDIVCNDVVSTDQSISKDDLKYLVASLESRSEHPLGKAIAETVKAHSAVEDFEYVPGRGVRGIVSGRHVVAGNFSFIVENCPDGSDGVLKCVNAAIEGGYTSLFVGVDGKTVGYVTLTDTVRSNSRYAIRHIGMVGLRHIMLTGDSKGVASRVRDELGMDDVVWECEPADKMRIVGKIDRDGKACMVGDGVNDAPSLKRAGVGIAMGGIGNDLSIDSADMVFMDDDLTKLPGLVRLCRRTLGTIHAGIAFSLVLNLAATVLAVMGLMDPVVGALVHNVGSVIVIVAAAAVLRLDPWRRGVHQTRRVGTTSKA